MDSNTTAAAFAALSQATRVRLLQVLAAAGSNGIPAGDLAKQLTVPSSTLSFHLAALEHAGLVQATRTGRHMIYAIRVAGLRPLLRFIAETCGDDDAAVPSEETPDAPSILPAFNVLFLCRHNSARSILAEAILARIGQGRFHAYSAGSDPVAAPNPEVIARLRALGHDTSGLRSKSWDEFAGRSAPRMDFVITLCEAPRDGRCPDFGGRAVTAAWPFPDPSQFTGAAVERAVLLNELYGAIRRRLRLFCDLPFASLNRMAVQTRLAAIGSGELQLA